MLEEMNNEETAENAEESIEENTVDAEEPSEN